MFVLPTIPPEQVWVVLRHEFEGKIQNFAVVYSFIHAHVVDFPKAGDCEEDNEEWNPHAPTESLLLVEPAQGVKKSEFSSHLYYVHPRHVFSEKRKAEKQAEFYIKEAKKAGRLFRA